MPSGRSSQGSCRAGPRLPCDLRHMWDSLSISFLICEVETGSECFGNHPARGSVPGKQEPGWAALGGGAPLLGCLGLAEPASTLLGRESKGPLAVTEGRSLGAVPGRSLSCLQTRLQKAEQGSRACV